MSLLLRSPGFEFLPTLMWEEKHHPPPSLLQLAHLTN